MYTGTWHENTYIVTGSSGSGKSEVCNFLAELGATVISADDLAKQALAPGSKALTQVREIFGDKVFSGEALNRKALGQTVFASSMLREKLENIVHPIIGELAKEAFTKLIAAGGQILIYDCPLYFETKLREKKFKGVILITAPEERKIARLVARDGITLESAKRRLSNQLSDKERAGVSDFIVDNSGSLEELKSKVQSLFSSLT